MKRFLFKFGVIKTNNRYIENFLKIIFVIMILLIFDCRTERERCYHNNKFDINNDDGCVGAMAAYSSANRIRNSIREAGFTAETMQNIGDAFLIQCIINIEKKKSCDAKSAFIPHIR